MAVSLENLHRKVRELDSIIVTKMSRKNSVTSLHSMLPVRPVAMCSGIQVLSTLSILIVSSAD